MNKNDKNKNVLHATVVATGRMVMVYKLKETEETYNIYLGDDITLERCERNEHTETFTAEQLKFN